MTILVLGYYKMASSAYAASYKLFDRELFYKELDELFELDEIGILEKSTMDNYQKVVKIIKNRPVK